MAGTIDKLKLEQELLEMRKVQSFFLEKYGVDDIWSNSKIYEIVIANTLGHILIPGHSGSKDAKDQYGNIFEYKHYKETSSNHTWTFNDYSDETIKALAAIDSVIFAHIDDTSNEIFFDWYYRVPGKEIAAHLRKITEQSTNKRKMWNVSVKQIEMLGYRRLTSPSSKGKSGHYERELGDIFSIAKRVEKQTHVTGVLTSNKLWEVLVAAELGHSVNSEQGGRAGAHDAFDDKGNNYEYKVSKTYSWQFQDISDNVLNKYKSDTAIILAVVDKTKMTVKKIYWCEPLSVIELLRQKLDKKRSKSQKPLRRLQATLTKGDLDRLPITVLK